MQTNGAEQPTPAAADVAQIQGGGLAHIFVDCTSPLSYSVFLNEKPVSQEDLAGFSLVIDASSPTNPMVRATLSRYVTVITGERQLQRQELFPCTVELIAAGRRVVVTCSRVDSLDGLWVWLGLRSDGSSNELSGLQSINILLEGTLLGAEIVWVDGVHESLLPL